MDPPGYTDISEILKIDDTAMRRPRDKTYEINNIYIFYKKKYPYAGAYNIILSPSS